MEHYKEFSPFETTYQADYKYKYEDKKGEKAKLDNFKPYIARPEIKIKQEPYQPRFTENLVNIIPSINSLPFNTTWRPKPITEEYSGTKTFCKVERVDPLLEEAIKTRPRLLQHDPAIYMDNVEPESRKILINAFYDTSTKHLMYSKTKKPPPKILPNTTLEKRANPIYNIYKYMDPKRDELPFGKELFWPKRSVLPDIKDEDPCKNLLPESERKKIRELLATDELRKVFYKPNIFYAGHTPKLVYGPLTRNEQ